MFDKEVIKHYGTYKVHPRSGWTAEVNLVSWNGHEPKYDIREWDPDHDKCTKGITLTEDELNTVYKIFKGLCEEEETDEGRNDREEDVFNNSEDANADSGFSGSEL